MPFINQNPEPKSYHITPYDYPISVIAVFNKKGDILPKYFCIEDENQELFVYKIETVDLIKYKHSFIEFNCSYIMRNAQYKATIIFDILSCKWYIKTPYKKRNYPT